MLKRKPSERLGCDGDNKGEDDHHGKNPYKNRPPDFAKLTAKYPDLLGPFVRISESTGKGSLNFTDAKAAEALTKTLLLHDFGLSVEILPGHLCPPLPNRINYLCWMSDLIDATVDLSCRGETAVNTKSVRVLDIGIGPVGIYPLLGHSLFGWSFVGSDVDTDAVQHCQRNIDTNPQLAGSISLVHVPGSAELQELIARDYLGGLCNAASAGGRDASQTGQSLASLYSSSSSNQHSNGSAASSACQGGPVAQAIKSMGSAVGAGVVKNHSAGATVAMSAQPIFQAVMCNPPFYDSDEQVRNIQCCGDTVCPFLPPQYAKVSVVP
jgi:23S rRNA A1618 N6-methylase RlmF